jgi:CrcB protein
MNWTLLIAIGSGGFIGAILRYLITLNINKISTFEISLGTLAVNLLGSFILGLFIALFTIIDISDNTKLFLTTGLMGALTTYSTFAMESFLLIDKSLNLFLINILSNLIGSILFAGLGYKLIIFFKG